MAARSRRRVAALLAVLAGAAALYAWGRGRYVTVLVSRLPSGALFLGEDPAHPDLAWLRRHESLDQAVGGSKDELVRLEHLARWSSVQLTAQDPFPHYPPWNARRILEEFRRRQRGGFCAQYAVIFGQAAQALGYSVRYVDLATMDKSSTHFITEVFVPSARKWAAFEAQHGFYYVDGARAPLSVHDVHARVLSGRQGDVRRSVDGRPVGASHAALFRRIRFYLRNNFLTVPVRVARIDHGEAGLEYKFEPYRLTWAGADDDEEGSRLVSRDRGDFTFSGDALPRVEARAHSRGGFASFRSSMVPGTVYRVSMPRGLLGTLIDEWIGDPRFLPLG